MLDKKSYSVDIFKFENRQSEMSKRSTKLIIIELIKKSQRRTPLAL
ncbi:hypothetical protein ATG66_0983 [Vibrio sp. ES.051]|nr:hypothetical protein ATG66_0983 [Vibrio sp. ES.051]